MYKDCKILSLIPARGGSKGIKNKNITNLNGRPLISYSIETALGSKYIDDIVVSTDSEEIAAVSIKYGAAVPFMRPKELASDEARTIDAVLHAINALEKKYDVLVLLQPTQPLRTIEEVDCAIESFFKNKMKGLVSVSRVKDHPLMIRTLNSDGSLTSLIRENSTCRRQDMRIYYKVNGCIYINKISELSEYTSFNDNEMGFVMEEDHAVDIDTQLDLHLAEYYIENTNKSRFN